MKNGKMEDLHAYRHDAEFFFKIGIKYANKKRFTDSLRYLSKAIEIEPSNADFNFNLACVFAELKEIKKSNKVLIGILKNIDPTFTECYFGIGCNYFDIGNLDKAKIYFEKYVYFDPEGEFVDETNNILYYLQMYDDLSLETKNRKAAFKLSKDGTKKLNNNFSFISHSKLEKVVENNWEDVKQKNELAISCFLNGEIDNAISLSKSILKIQPENIDANCNLALVYARTGKLNQYNKQLRSLAGIEVNRREEFLKLLDTYIHLNEHSSIIRILINYLRENRNACFYHLLSVAFFNIKQHDSASDVWNAMMGFFPQYNIIVKFYNKINVDTKNGLMEFALMEYSKKLPESLESKLIEKFDTCIQLEPAMFKKVWKRDSDLRDIILYNLYEADSDVKIKTIEFVSKIKSVEIRGIIKSLLDEEDISDEIKEYILKVLEIKNYALNDTNFNNK